jgi:hypothetical protein
MISKTNQALVKQPYLAKYCKIIATVMALQYSILSIAQDIPETPISSPDASHYAFANYLGSGVYRTSGQSAAVANIPISVVIDQAEDHLVKLRLPISLGFFDYSFNDLPGGQLPKSVGTITFTPGVEYHWFVDEQLTIESYLDMGYGYNFSNESNVGIMSFGISSVYQIDMPTYSPTWINRLYSAGYRSSLNDSAESYSVLQSGLDFGLGTSWLWDDIEVEPRLFFAGRWFFDKLTFVNPVGADVVTNHTYEVGATWKFSKPIGYDVFGWDGLKIDRLGMSYQVGGGLQVWRLIFEFPL